jgi:hypothetical protein
MSEAESNILEMLDSIEDAVNLDVWSERSPSFPKIEGARSVLPSDNRTERPSARAFNFDTPIFEATLRRYPDPAPTRAGTRVARGTTAEILATFCWNTDK